MEPRELVLAIKAKGLTQKQIEAETGIPQPTISKIERGDVADVMSRSYRALLTLHAKLTKPARRAAKAGA
jgi:transcriptional regulator with XRE-family HTH domain